MFIYRTFLKVVFNDDSKEKTAFYWYLLYKSQINALIFFKDNCIELSIESLSKFHKSSNILYLKKKYYTLISDKCAEYIAYKYPKSGVYNNIFELNSIPVLPIKECYKKIEFYFNDSLYTFNIKLNVNYIDYLKDIPIFKLEGTNQLYLDFSSEIENSLIKEIKNCTETFSEKEKVEFILNFTQKSAKYGSDIKRWGFNKVDFPEVVLADSLADCENYSMLFSMLLKKVYDIESVNVTYDKHMNVGVKMNTIEKGWNTVTYKSIKYVVCSTVPNGVIGDFFPKTPVLKVSPLYIKEIKVQEQNQSATKKIKKKR